MRGVLAFGVSLVFCAPSCGAPPVAAPPSSTAAAPAFEAHPAPAPEASAPPVAVPPEPEPDPQSAPAPAPVEAVPALVDASGQVLPQTEDRPSVESASFRRRLELLVEAIAKDQPDIALPAFFPVEAYAEVKDIAKPERDWEWRLVGAFKRNIHDYHKQLGEAASGVRLVGIDVPEAKVAWMKPNSEGNRIGYFRVLRSRLKLVKPDSSEVGLEVTSLISWRGEWYVVHLHGFK